MISYIRSKIHRLHRWLKYDPPYSLSYQGWQLFNKEFKEKAPIRYFISRQLSAKIHNNIIFKKCKFIKDYLKYRFIDRYHVVDTNLKPNYYEISERMLHSSFNLLKDFVEVEQAWDTFCWSGEINNKPKWKKYIPFYYRNFRRPDIGIKHFEWASELDDPSLAPYDQSIEQARNAREILQLYYWWTKTRPERKLHDLPNLSNRSLEDFEDFENLQDCTDYLSILHKNTELQKNWQDEDTQMFIRLIKIREALWT